MINQFDKSVTNKYGTEHLKKICRANMKLVPENIIIAMKSAILLECFPADKDSCHRFLGWDIEKFAYHKMQGIPLNIMFENMQKTFQPSCSTICINPDVHFEEFSANNKCFPLEKVFSVFRHISSNTANKLLDQGLIEVLSQQITTRETKKNLKVFTIPEANANKSGLLNWFKKTKDFKVLLVNFDILTMDSDEILLKNEEYKILFDNLIENLQKNFTHALLTRPPGENMLMWENYVDKFLKDVDIFVVLLSNSNINYIDGWKSNTMPREYESLNSDLNSNDFEKFEEILIDEKIKYQHFVWKKMCSSDKLKVAVTFDTNIISAISKYFPIACVLPKEMQNLIFLIDKIKKTK